MSIKEAQLKRLSLFGTVVALSLVISGVVLAQSNPSVGTWKLNLAKSHYSPGPPPKSQTVVNEANGNGIKSTTTGTAADGSAVSYSYTVVQEEHYEKHCTESFAYGGGSGSCGGLRPAQAGKPDDRYRHHQGRDRQDQRHGTISRVRDENAKVVDIGDGWSMEVGVIHRASTGTRRPRLLPAGRAKQRPAIPCGEQMANPPADAIPGAITHDNQTEGYYIVSGGGTAFIDGHVINGRHSTANPDGGPNGPGCGGLAVGSRKVELKVGDVLIVPPGVIHGWADIPDHVDYLSFRPSHGVMKNGWVNPTIASNRCRDIFHTPLETRCGCN
jgi:hypothetical protein